MSINEIMNWISSHNGQSKKEDYTEYGNRTKHVVRYENGDTYQHIETYNGIMEKQTETILNGQTVLKQDLVYKPFGWYERGAI